LLFGCVGWFYGLNVSSNKELGALPGRYLIIIISLSMSLLLFACGNHTYHVVRPGETLYSIGWLYGYDYRRIALWNNIDEPYAINDGQIIKVVPPKGEATRNSRRSANNVVDVSVDNVSNNVSNNKSRKQSNKSYKNNEFKSNINNSTANNSRDSRGGIDRIAWKWPTVSKNIVQYFSASDIRRRGLKIAGRNGQSIKAAASGRVVYSGSGLIGYGRLIIIKHSGAYLSAYAHNRELLVTEGDEIKRGQRIATMGSSGTNRVMLHFEIRRKGVPVNPLDFLPQRG